MEGNEPGTERAGAPISGAALMESLITTGKGTIPLGEATYQDWLAKRALDAANATRNTAPTDRFLAELRPYFVTETTTTREALRQYFAERPGDRRVALFGLSR